MHKNLLLVVTAMVTVATAGAQDLTLEESVMTAVGGNPAVTAARERSQAAAARYKGGQQHRLPKIGLSESFVYTDNPAEVFALSLNQGRFDIQEFFLSDPNNPDPLSTWITRLDLEFPVYTGGRLSARIGQAESMATAEDLSYAHVREQVAFETTTAYINLAKAREQASLLDNSRATTAEHLRIAEQFALQGIILDADVLQARVYLSEVDDSLAQAGSGARLAQAALNFQMGADQNTPRALSPVTESAAVSGDLEGWIAAALEDRNDLNAARRKLEAGRLEERASRPGFFPEIAVVGHYDLYDDQIFGANGRSGSIMAVAKIDLLGGGAGTAARTAARHETASFEADVHRFEEGVRLEVRQAWQDLATARTRLETATSSLAAAREALRVRESRFKQGLDKMIDLLDAETALRESEMRELVARYDVALETYRLRYVSGATLIPSMEDSQ